MAEARFRDQGPIQKRNTVHISRKHKKFEAIHQEQDLAPPSCWARLLGNMEPQLKLSLLYHVLVDYLRSPNLHCGL